MRIEEKEYTKSIDISIWKKVFPFLAPRKNVLIMVIVMNILCSVVDIIMPLFQRQAIDSFIEKNTLAGLGGFIALYIAVIVFQMWSVICFTRWKPPHNFVFRCCIRSKSTVWSMG